MKPKVFVTRVIPQSGIKLLEQHCEVKVSTQDGVIAKKELIDGVTWCDALLCLLTESVARRIPESDKYTRLGKYKGWAPMLFLGAELKRKTLGIIGLGRIGIGVVQRAKAMGMKICYYDIKRDHEFEMTYQADFGDIDTILKEADFISIHVPLLPSTKHLIGHKQLDMMKKTAYLINTSRGPVIDEKALVEALKNDEIAGAALDVFEFEPDLSEGLAALDNVVLTPHTASATHETRSAMSTVAASNILDVLRGTVPRNLVNKDAEASLSMKHLIS
jgi:lactate dehydrogenase-like 2-hydroxyacid dehydrogenase